MQISKETNKLFRLTYMTSGYKAQQQAPHMQKWVHWPFDLLYFTPLLIDYLPVQL